jgi:hypothetical protein
MSKSMFLYDLLLNIVFNEYFQNRELVLHSLENVGYMPKISDSPYQLLITTLRIVNFDHCIEFGKEFGIWKVILD